MKILFLNGYCIYEGGWGGAGGNKRLLFCLSNINYIYKQNTENSFILSWGGTSPQILQKGKFTEQKHLQNMSLLDFKLGDFSVYNKKFPLRFGESPISNYLSSLIDITFPWFSRVPQILRSICQGVIKLSLIRHLNRQKDIITSHIY